MRANRDRRAGVAWALLLGLTVAATSTAAGAAEGDGGKVVHSEKGEASFYGPGFKGKTASGEPYEPDDLTAAHPELPLGTEVTVTNTETGKEVEVEINDRGPYVDGRVIDLSTKAAEEIGITKKEGVAPVEVEATAAQVEEGKTDELGKKAEAPRGEAGEEESKRKKPTAD